MFTVVRPHPEALRAGFYRSFTAWFFDGAPSPWRFQPRRTGSSWLAKARGFRMDARERLPLMLDNRKPDDSYSNKTRPRAKEGFSFQRRDAAQAATTSGEA